MSAERGPGEALALVGHRLAGLLGGVLELPDGANRLARVRYGTTVSVEGVEGVVITVTVLVTVEVTV